MRARPSIAVLGFLAAAASPLLAEQPVSASVRPKTYGTQDQIVLTLSPCDAAQRDLTNPFQVFTCDFLTAKQPNVFNSAVPAWVLHLPEGALLDEVDFYYYDTIVDSEPFVTLQRMGQGNTDQIINDSLPAWSTGNNNASFVLIPPVEIHNDNFNYVLAMQLDTTDAGHYTGLYNITVRYRLQVSPAPATATFNDVPTNHPFFQFIEALAASGITGGCGGGNYCPDAPLTRGQMAVFLSKALGLHWPVTAGD
jgi:hypothetical protein